MMLAYAGACVWIRVHETQLVYPRSQPFSRPASSLALHEERVEFGDLDGVPLYAWIVPSLPGDSSKAWVLFFHGSGDNVSSHAADYYDFRSLGFNIMAPEYPGYLDSPGTPGEAGLEREARAAYEYVRTVRGARARDIVIYGISLGAAVAIDLAGQVEAGALIPCAAFASLVAAARELHPWLPMGLLLKNRYESEAKIGRVRMPVLVIHSEEDNLLDLPRHGGRLYDLARQPKRLLRTRGRHGTDSTNAAVNPSLFADIGEFLNEVAGFHLRAPLPSIAPEIDAALRSGGIDAALARYRALGDQRPQRYGVQETELQELGALLLDRGETEAAVAILGLNAGQYPDSDQVHEDLGDAVAAAGRTEEALREYRRALQLFSGDDVHLRRKIERLGGDPGRAPAAATGS